MPPGINAGIVDIDKTLQTLGIINEQFRALQLVAMIELQEYSLNNKDKTVQEITRLICGELYNPKSYEDCLNCIIHFTLIEEMKSNLVKLQDCLLK